MILSGVHQLPKLFFRTFFTTQPAPTQPAPTQPAPTPTIGSANIK
jgi:hypothetical protein